MNDLLDSFMKSDAALSSRGILLSMLVCFLLTSLIGAVYVWTYRGLSYSRSFVHSLVLGGFVSTLLLMAIGNSVARGLGILGTLALIRFRTTLKDTRDMVFVFASLAVGVAAGVQSFTVAILGTGGFCLLVLYLAFSPFGSRRQFDALLRFQSPSTPGSDGAFGPILKEFCSRFVLINLRDTAQGNLVELAYQIKLAHPEYRESLLERLRGVPGLTGISLLCQDQWAEA